MNSPLLHGNISSVIIGCAFQVHRELGTGFLESVYTKSLTIALREAGLRAEPQFPLQVTYHGKSVGDFFVDILVEECVVVELKAAKSLAPEHEAQIINYLKASRLQVGLLFNFGSTSLEYKRFTRTLQPNS
jgi:GxxExxY protein